jgi:hypothetical protein
VVSAVDRATLPAGSAEPIKLSGQRLMLVGALRAVQGNQAVPATDVRSSADSVTATIAFPTGSTGKWDLVVSDAAGREATLRQAVTVT